MSPLDETDDKLTRDMMEELDSRGFDVNDDRPGYTEERLK